MQKADENENFPSASVLFCPTDFGDIKMFCQAVKVAIEFLNPLFVSLRSLIKNTFFLLLFLHLFKLQLGFCFDDSLLLRRMTATFAFAA